MNYSVLCSATMADGNVVEVDFSDLIDKKWTSILTDFQFFCTTGKHVKFATKPIDNTQLRVPSWELFRDTV